MWVFLCLISEFYGLALVDTWHFSKCTWSLDRQVTWKSTWGPFSLTHNPTNFNCHWHCKTGNAPFLFVNITWSHDRLVTRLDGCDQLSLCQTLLKLAAIPLDKVEISIFLHITWSHELQIGASLCYKLGQLCFITN